MLTVKQINSKIDSLGKLNLKVESTIQELGLVCMAHADVHGDVTVMNRLVNVLRRTQHQAFTEWCLAFGKFKRNTDKAKADVAPLVYDKSRTTDIEGATAKEWFMFADAKAEAIAKAFDLQAAVKALLKKAAANGADHEKLLALASVVDIKPEQVPATVTKPTVDAPEALV
jgi:hypothetical protein